MSRNDSIPPGAMLETDQNLDDTERLLSFLRERDVPCPVCRYNLRDLQRPVCPECRQPLTMTVGTTELKLGWFIATITPGLFSGVAAGMLSVPMIIAPILNNANGAPWPFWVLDGFGWASGLFAMCVIGRRRRFFRLSASQQAAWAAGTWAVHVTAFVVLMWSILR